MDFDTNSEPPTPLSITSPTFSDLSSSPLTPHKDEEQVGSVTHIPEHAEQNDKSNCECLGIKLVIDNVNKNVVPRNTTSEQQTKSLHYVHMYRVEDRISIGHLSHDPPERSTSIFSAEVFKSVLLSPNDNETMANYFSLLVSRVLVTHMHFFNMTFADVVDWHIPHQFSQNMAKALMVVSQTYIQAFYYN